MTQQFDAEAMLTVIDRTGLSPDKHSGLLQTLAPFVAEAGELIRKSEGINVTDATQVTEIKAARAARLALRAVRVKVENARKELKADALKTGQAIDACANWIKERVEPEEARLQALEDFAERAEAKRKAELKASREALVAPYGADVQFVDLGGMDEPTFQRFLEGARLAHEGRIAAAEKAAAEAKAKAEAEAAEQARIRADNERMRLEAVEREKAQAEERARLKAEREAAEAAAKAERDRLEAEARAEREARERELAAERAKADAERRAAEEAARVEREKFEAQARKEREAREKIEREQAEARAAEERKRKAEAAAAKRAAAAPDADKLRAWSKAMKSVPAPAMTTQSGKDASALIADWVGKLAARIDEMAAKLGGDS